MINNNDTFINNNNNSDNYCVKIKTEPKEELIIDETLDIKEEPPDIKSVVLKFKKNIDGNYSVIPPLDLEDNKTSLVKIKEEKPAKTSNNNCAKCLFYATHEKEKLKRHQQRVHPRKTWNCTFCNKKDFKEKLSLQQHFLYLHRDNEDAMQLITNRIFSCKVCTYKSLKKNNYERHLATHKPKTKESEADYKDINKGNTFNCFHCPYGATDKGSIVKHVRLHKSDEYKPFTCTKCNTKYNEKGCLDSHIVKHHSQDKELIASVTSKIYNCEFCSYKDVNKAKMSRHKQNKH